ncbi:Short chain dehydrogenase [gamma proteobacterium IMCC2047]|nr:Short chain dehydrogenase [gamma proteobacterium IMCC2047]
MACARDISGAELAGLAMQYEQVSLHPLDVSSDASIADFANELADQPVDLLINNAGVYGTGGSDLGQLTREEWRQVLEVNTLSPLMLTQALLANIEAGQLKIIAMMSSKVGSIADNGSGGSYYYRSSKTALNQVVKSLSIDLASRGIKVVALHPGWVKTSMGGPNALIDTQQSVQGLRAVLEELNDSRSGCFYGYDGAGNPR